MSDQHDRPILLGDGALGGRDVVGERGRRVLDDGDVIAVLIEDLLDAVPAGAIDEAAMHEDDGICCVVRHLSSPFQKRWMVVWSRSVERFLQVDYAPAAAGAL